MLTRNELHGFYEVLRRSGVNCRFCSMMQRHFLRSAAYGEGLTSAGFIWLCVSSKCFWLVNLSDRPCNINMEGDIPDILEQFMSSSLVTWVSCSLLRAKHSKQYHSIWVITIISVEDQLYHYDNWQTLSISVCVCLYCYFCPIGYICFVL